MKLFIQTTVFNRELVGKAIYLKGYCVDGHKYDGAYLVASVDGEYINVINHLGREYMLHLENFSFKDKDSIKVTLLTPAKGRP